MSIRVINDDIDLDYMVEVVSAWSAHCEVSSFPLEVHQYFLGDTALNQRAQKSPSFVK